MPRVSDVTIATAAKAQGLAGSQVAVAVAVALAESGGNTTSHNPVPPDNSYGLWQINMLGSLGPERRRMLGIASNEALYDINVNARAMRIISNGGTNWRPWTTYTRGTYLGYMGRGNAAVGSTGSVPASPPGSVPAVPAGLGVPSLTGLTELLSWLRDPKFWIRVGFVVGGAAFLLFGLARVTGDNRLSEGTKSIGKALVGLVPGGGTVVQGVNKVVK